MTEEKYPQYKKDFQNWQDNHAHWQRCDLCGNSGYYMCRVVETCGATKRDHTGNLYNHAHACFCDPSGGSIMKKQRDFERADSEREVNVS